MTVGGTRARPRILVLATTVPAQEGDGTPAFVLTLARALGDDNDITILTPRVPGGPARQRIGNVQVKRFRYFPRRFERLAHGAIMPNLEAEPWRLVEVPPLVAAFLAAATGEVRRMRPDVVHAHWLFPCGVIALALRRAFGTPYIVTAHAADVFRFRSAPFRALKRRVVADAAVATAVSRETAAALGLSPEEAEKFVAPMGVDTDRLTEAVGTRAPQNGRFLFVGRLVEKKGVDVLLRALAQVRDGRLVVVGDGPQRRQLEELRAQLDLRERVTFAGQQGEKAVAKELRVAQALVVPSRVAGDGDADGTPVVMGEAMTAGVPVIASRLGGLAEHIVSGVNGLLVEPDDPVSLAQALRRVLDESETAASWADAARATSREHFDVRVTARRYQEFISAALNGSAASAS